MASIISSILKRKNSSGILTSSDDNSKDFYEWWGGLGESGKLSNSKEIEKEPKETSEKKKKKKATDLQQEVDEFKRKEREEQERRKKEEEERKQKELEELRNMKGFLTKKGDIIKNWKPRYFIIKGSVLHYYEDSTLSNEKGQIKLNDATAQDDEYFSTSEGRENIFCILTKERKYFIQAASVEEKEKWIKALKLVISESNHNAQNSTPQPIQTEKTAEKPKESLNKDKNERKDKDEKK